MTRSPNFSLLLQFMLNYATKDNPYAIPEIANSTGLNRETIRRLLAAHTEWFSTIPDSYPTEYYFSGSHINAAALLERIMPNKMIMAANANPVAKVEEPIRYKYGYANDELADSIEKMGPPAAWKKIQEDYPALTKLALPDYTNLMGLLEAIIVVTTEAIAGVEKK
jgi:hypothetical protein